MIVSASFSFILVFLNSNGFETAQYEAEGTSAVFHFKSLKQCFCDVNTFQVTVPHELEFWEHVKKWILVVLVLCKTFDFFVHVFLGLSCFFLTDACVPSYLRLSISPELTGYRSTCKNGLVLLFAVEGMEVTFSRAFVPVRGTSFFFQDSHWNLLMWREF